MDRRSFLKGTFGGVAAAGALIVTATPAEVSEFASKTLVGAPIAASELEEKGANIPSIGEIVFDSHGNPLGVVHSMDIQREMLDITDSSDIFRKSMVGPVNCELRVSVFGSTMVKHGKR